MDTRDLGETQPQATATGDRHAVSVAEAAPVPTLAKTSTAKFWTGAPAEIDIGLQLPVDHLSETDLEAGVELIHRTMGEAGILSRVGGSVDWLCNRRLRKVHISIVTRDSRTIIRAREQLGPLAATLFGGIVGWIGVCGIGWVGFIVGLNTFHSMPIGLAAWGTIAAASYAVTRPIYTAIAGRRASQLRQVVAELAERLGGAAAGSATPIEQSPADHAIAAKPRI
jgi:hypothetical protein